MSVSDVTFGGRPSPAALAATVALGLAALLLATPLVVPVPPALRVFLDTGVLFLLYGMLVLGLNLQYGFTGLVNFGHVAFFAVGAYTVGMLAAVDPFTGIGLGLPWAVALVAGVFAAGLLGVLIGMTTLRLREDFLGIVTLAAAEIIHDLLGSFQSITGGGIGLNGIPQPIADVAGGTDTALLSSFLLFGSFALFAYVLLERLVTAPYGRVLRAIRADELVAKTIGKDTFGYKMQSFVIGAALAGFAGGLYALFLGSVAPGFFTLNVTVTVWIGMLLGGAANNRGVLLGLLIIVSLRLATRFMLDVTPVTQDQFASLRLAVIGLVLILVIRYRPEGLWGNAKALGFD